MPSTRLGHDQQINLALDDLTHLGSLLDDLSIVVTGPQQVSIRSMDDTGWPAKVIAFDAVGEAEARHLVATQARGHTIVVANRITAPARQYLAEQNWAWLDRRIGAHIPIGRRDIEVRYPSRQRGGDRGDSRVGVPRPSAEGPIRGRAGIAYAAALLCNPDDPPSFRSIALAVDMTPTAISNAVQLLRAASLVSDNLRPTIPDLFWVLSEVWVPLQTVAVASLPDPNAPGSPIGLDRLDQPGWVLGGDLAAVELGAPLFTTDSRPWLWVPTHLELRRAERALGSVAWDNRAGALAVPPTPMVCRWRRPAGPGTRWPRPHPLFAALELARDPGRGREILAKWSPEGADPVWR